jgi:hypothetical protein
MLVGVPLVWSPEVTAQWSSDPSQNLMVCDTTGEQVLPKIAATSDGGCYISWFDSRAGSYRVYMQKLNAQGVKQWEPNGLLISSNPQSSSLVDYDLVVDDSNNAVVVFTDTRSGSQINPFAYRISSQGVFLWGADGVSLSTAPAVYQPNPKVVMTSDGGFVFVWVYASTPNKIAMQRLSRTGVKQWGAYPILLSGSANENLTYPSAVGSDSGSIILMMSGYTGTFLNPQNYRLYSQKFSSAGSPLWTANPDTVYSLGRVAGYFVPKIFSDGNSGAIYVWQDDRNAASRTTSYVQRFTSSAAKLFPINGSASSLPSDNNRFDAWACYMPATDETYMFWKETNGLQSLFGIYGQRFSGNGTRLWADAGAVFKPLGSNTTVNQICFAKDTSIVVFFNEAITGSNNNLIKGFGTDRSGNLGWGGSILTVSSPLSSKSKVVGAFLSNGTTLLAWSDQRLDAGGIYAQNVSINGLLGNVSDVPGEHRDEFPSTSALYQNYPNPFNPETNFGFRISHSGMVSFKVFDLLGRTVATLLNEELGPGKYAVMWDASGFPSGVYFFQLKAGSSTETKKLTLMR